MRPPTARRLLMAYAVVDRLVMSLPTDEVTDVAGADIWLSLVEARKAIATTTHYLAESLQDDGYYEAWQKMHDREGSS
jgi:hypothetical protein